MPPTPRPAARGQARGVLSLEAIVDEAMRIIDREGIDEVSMRRIAGEPAEQLQTLSEPVAHWRS